MTRSTRARKRVGIPEADWHAELDVDLYAEMIDGPPAGMVRLQHRQPITLAILVTPEAIGHASAVWSTGAGVGTGSNPGWHIGLDHTRVWFSVEQSGGQKPARRTVEAVRDVRLGDHLCIVAHHHDDQTIQLTVNEQTSDRVPIDGYGRLDCNEDSRIGGLVGFSPEHCVSGRYHRVAVWRQTLSDRQTQVITATWLQGLE